MKKYPVEQIIKDLKKNITQYDRLNERTQQIMEYIGIANFEWWFQEGDFQSWFNCTPLTNFQEFNIYKLKEDYND